MKEEVLSPPENSSDVQESRRLGLVILLVRMFRAAKLDAHLYKEVKGDPGTIIQSFVVVFLSSLAYGIANVGKGNAVLERILMSGSHDLIRWLFWFFLIYIIGTKLLPEQRTKIGLHQFFRTVGFSTAPGLIRIVAVAPQFSLAAFLAAELWMLGAAIVAVREALGYTRLLRAVIVCIFCLIITELSLPFLLLGLLQIFH